MPMLPPSVFDHEVENARAVAHLLVGQVAHGGGGQRHEDEPHRHPGE